MKGDLSGGCICGDVRYVLEEGFRLSPYVCHCTDCQARTGSAFSEHMAFMLDNLKITGELNEGHLIQPSGAHSRIIGCAKCMARIYAISDRRPGFGSLRCGTLDNSSQLMPVAHLWVQSKQPWIRIPENVQTMAKQPDSVQEWINLLTDTGPTGTGPTDTSGTDTDQTDTGHTA